MAKLMRTLLATMALAAAWNACAESVQAQDYCGPSSHPDLFYNYYVAPVPCGPHGAVGAQLYVSPRPTPPLVGHTYITYQPLLPHEFLYGHHRVYWRDHGPHGGITRTTVRYNTIGLHLNKCKNCGPGYKSSAPAF